VSGYPRSEAYAAFQVPGRFLMDGPVFTRSRVVGIEGKDRVRRAIVENIETGKRTTVECDTVVFTGDWIPDHEIARTGGLAMDAATRGPVVDAGLRTSSPGVFAVGNLLHPVDTADGAALDGRHVAAAVTGWLRNHGETPKAVRIRTNGPFKWVAPQLVSPEGGVAARGDLLFWVDEYRRLPKLRAVQDGRTLATKRTPWPAAPGRVYRAPWSLVTNADPAGGDVTVSFA